MSQASSVTLSVVIPVFNEEENVVPMIEALKEALQGIKSEVIFVDDGSTDKTVEKLQEASSSLHLCKVVTFARNYGQTAAMSAGIEEAQGTYIVTLDGDLQNDPQDIPKMLKLLEEEDLDIVAGNRKNRQDGLYFRLIPSKIANWLIRKLTHVHVRDYGCTLKLFRADIAKRLDLYGELHRFIPILGAIEGAKIKEIHVKHHARQFGQSKYGLGRTFKVISDLMLMVFFLKYRQKPMHLFGGLGTLMLLVGGLIESYLLMLKIMGHDIGGRPLFYVGILLLITGVQFITAGFLAELMMRTYYAANDKRTYNIRSIYESRANKSKQRRKQRA